jgi:hypothetical protein
MLRGVFSYLHKVRATFATWHLWEGVDLRTDARLAWTLRHGIKLALSQTFAESGSERQSGRHVRVIRQCLSIHSETVLGQQRTQVPMRNDGMVPFFAPL